MEVAGLILGAVPLLISAIEHYDTIKSHAFTLLRYRNRLEHLVECLKVQQALLRVSMIQILKGAGSDVADDMSQEECAVRLRETSDVKVKEYLGPSYDMVLFILGKYEKSIKSIISRLEHINRLPNTEKDDLDAILKANATAKGSFKFTKRVEFTANRKKLDQMIKDLEGHQSLMDKFVEKGEKISGYTMRQPSKDAQRLLGIFARVRSHAVPLLAAVCKIRTCLPDCSSRHKILIRLDNRILTQEPTLKLDTTFTLALALETDLQETSVKVCQDEQMKGKGAKASSQDPTSPIPLINVVPASPRPAIITDICYHAYNARNSRRVLGLQLIEDDLSLLEGSPGTWRDFLGSHPETLDDLLRKAAFNKNMQLSPKEQTLLALDLAASILQLRQTSWFDFQLNSRNIKFLTQNEANKTISALFFEQVMERNVSTARDPDSSTLLELAILLLEIWHHKPLDMWATTAINTEGERALAARRWLGETDTLPIDYRTAIEQCLSMYMTRMGFWDDDTSHKEYCENIIKPLREICKIW